ncbi:GbsR/MarR family transcriptional regulator [Brevibacterium aurantiacum]|uniref:MarR family transcriptional regulator n=1 Tax=Brevibacterium aurantiacum TaxID=273384 RepID=A0A556C5X7_BREAU|nr:hypothetical protein [Brevibacterium aurantiacum]TSI12842.1 hypothetical protein FO013_18845 [Brevibacterium aurantiacum]
MQLNESGDLDNTAQPETELPSEGSVSELTPDIRNFIDRFTDAWEMMRGKRINGRVLGLLIITDEPYLSSADLGRLLNASNGAISTATRALVGSGYIKGVSLPNSRSRYFKAEDDVWGNFLSREKLALTRMSEVLRSGLSTEPGSQPGPARRLRNGSRYMDWVDQFHHNLLEQWRTYRDQEEDTPPPQELPKEMVDWIRREEKHE